MKILLTSILFCLTFVTMNASANELMFKIENSETDPKKEVKKSASGARNFHSVKKWKITIEFNNGKTIQKIITANKSSDLSAMDTAFNEAESYLKTLRSVRKVKGYTVTPVSSHSYVLLAGK